MYHIQLVGFYSLFYNEISRIMRIWVQSIIPPIVTSVLYYTIFGQLMGERIGSIKNVQYIEFIAPGLIMMSVINNAYSNVVSSLYTAKFSRYIEEMLISPMWNISILFGYIFAGVVRGMIVGACVLGITMFFVKININNIPLTIYVMFLSCILLANLGFFNGLLATKFDDTTVITTFILTPLTYLGGVFYSITLLPHPWDKIALFNPILYIVNLFRYSTIGISDIDISNALTILTTLCIGSIILNLYMLNNGIGIKKK